jgi:ribosomal protein S18 acetylase RimI-like enzyme
MSALKVCYLPDIDKVYNLMQRVYNELEDKSLFVCDSREELVRNVTRGGFPAAKPDLSGCIGLETPDGELAACVVTRIPGLEADNLGYDLGFSLSQCMRVAHIETVVVAPGYRRRGFQTLLLQLAELALDKDRYCHLMATVSSDNVPSCRAFEKNGYHVAAVREKYGGLTRRIYMKNVGV